MAGKHETYLKHVSGQARVFFSIITGEDPGFRCLHKVNRPGFVLEKSDGKGRCLL